LDPKDAEGICDIAAIESVVDTVHWNDGLPVMFSQ
jgi:hypothetical protein